MFQRSNIMHLIDLLKGGSLKRKFKTIDSFHYDGYRSNEKLLAEILKHAKTSVKYYSNIESKAEISDFPVINKNIIKDHYQDFFSNEFSLESLIPIQTSGSTGTPFTFYLDKEKKKHRAIEIAYYNSWADYKLGDKHILNAVGGKKSKLKLFLQNEILTNPLHLDGTWLENQRKLIKNGGVRFYIGYASAVDQFTKYCSSKGDSPKDFNLKGIIAIAEKLKESTRELAEKTFGCKVLSRYASAETGVLSHECPEEKKHHLNTAGYYIEILALDSDKTVGFGKIGRVVVTDLYSFGMPLIRYDTGDLAILSNEKCKCGRTSPIFEKLEGRAVENVTDPDGNLISWIAINDALWPYTEISEFQFIQLTKNSYKLKLVSNQKNKSDDKILRDYLGILGKSAKLELEYVDKIEYERSGKKPYIINQYLKDKLQLNTP